MSETVIAAFSPFPLTSPKAINAPAAVQGDHLEEIAAHFFRGTIHAGYRQAGNRRRLFGNENLLHFAGRLYFKFDPRLTFPLQKLLPRDGENQSQKQQRAEDKHQVEEVAAEVKAETGKTRQIVQWVNRTPCPARLMMTEKKPLTPTATIKGHSESRFRRINPKAMMTKTYKGVME